jgi:hypothetical protein
MLNTCYVFVTFCHQLSLSVTISKVIASDTGKRSDKDFVFANSSGAVARKSLPFAYHLSFLVTFLNFAGSLGTRPIFMFLSHPDQDVLFPSLYNALQRPWAWDTDSELMHMVSHIWTQTRT